MPCEYDTYFPPSDSHAEVARMPNAECRPIRSIREHMTRWNPADRAFFDAALGDALEE